MAACVRHHTSIEAVHRRVGLHEAGDGSLSDVCVLSMVDAYRQPILKFEGVTSRSRARWEALQLLQSLFIKLLCLKPIFALRQPGAVLKRGSMISLASSMLESLSPRISYFYRRAPQ